MKKWVFCLVVGLAMLAFSTGAGINDDKQVRCGDEIMMPGDVCEETRGGATVDTETYDEIKSRQESARRTFNSWGRWALLGGGVVLTAAGVLGIVAARKRRRVVQGTAQPQGAAGQQPAGYPLAGPQPPASHQPPRPGYPQPVGQPQSAGHAQPAGNPPARPQPPANHQPPPAGYPQPASYPPPAGHPQPGYQQPDFGPQPTDFGPTPGS